MSTWIYMVCTDHDPPIRAESESGQHLYDIPQLREDLTQREDITALSADDFSDVTTELDPFFDRYTLNTWRFLRPHPLCNLEIHDEYGRHYPLTEAPE